MAIKKWRIKGEAFKADQEGIDQLKDEFIEKAQDFVCYRKGEWHGINSSIKFVKRLKEDRPKLIITPQGFYPNIEMVSDDIIKIVPRPNPGNIEYLILLGILLKYYPEIKEIGKDMIKVGKEAQKFLHKYIGKRTSENILSARVICGESVDLEQIAKWEELCGKDGVAIIPGAKKSPVRYILNEKRYAIFARLEDDYLQGIIGKDTKTITMLRLIFDKEFYGAKAKDFIVEKS